MFGYAEELRPVLPRRPLLIDQSQVGLVDEGRRLQRVIAPFTAEVGRGALVEILVKQRHELVSRASVSCAPGVQ
jgi:hypothetical protein